MLKPNMTIHNSKLEKIFDFTVIIMLCKYKIDICMITNQKKNVFKDKILNITLCPYKHFTLPQIF